MFNDLLSLFFSNNNQLTSNENLNDTSQADQPADNSNTQYLNQFEPGSPDARLAWEKVEDQALSESSVQKAQSLGYENARGMYNNRPLIAGEAGGNQADFIFMRDKLIYFDGYDYNSANKIAGSIAHKLSTGR